MSNYFSSAEEYKTLTIMVSYLFEGAREWRIAFKETEEGRKIHNWQDLKSPPASRFEILNKEKVAWDKLERCKRLKDVLSFNGKFEDLSRYPQY